MMKSLGQGLSKLGERLCEKAGIDAHLVTEIDIKISAEDATEIIFHTVDLDIENVDEYATSYKLICLDPE